MKITILIATLVLVSNIALACDEAKIHNQPNTSLQQYGSYNQLVGARTPRQTNDPQSSSR